MTWGSQNSSPKARRRTASVCAGTDSPRLVVEALVDALNEMFQAETKALPLVAAHAFSAESDPAKQGFLAVMHDFKSAPLFGDVRTLHNIRLWDLLPNRNQLG